MKYFVTDFVWLYTLHIDIELIYQYYYNYIFFLYYIVCISNLAHANRHRPAFILIFFDFPLFRETGKSKSGTPPERERSTFVERSAQLGQWLSRRTPLAQIDAISAVCAQRQWRQWIGKMSAKPHRQQGYWSQFSLWRRQRNKAFALFSIEYQDIYYPTKMKVIKVYILTSK